MKKTRNFHHPSTRLTAPSPEPVAGICESSNPLAACQGGGLCVGQSVRILRGGYRGEEARVTDVYRDWYERELADITRCGMPMTFPVECLKSVE